MSMATELREEVESRERILSYHHPSGRPIDRKATPAARSPGASTRRGGEAPGLYDASRDHEC